MVVEDINNSDNNQGNDADGEIIDNENESDNKSDDKDDNGENTDNVREQAIIDNMSLIPITTNPQEDIDATISAKNGP